MEYAEKSILEYWPEPIAVFIKTMYWSPVAGYSALVFYTLTAIVAADIIRATASALTRTRASLVLAVTLGLWAINSVLMILAFADSSAILPVSNMSAYDSLVFRLGTPLAINLIVAVVLSVVVPLILLRPHKPEEDSEPADRGTVDEEPWTSKRWGRIKP